MWYAIVAGEPARREPRLSAERAICPTCDAEVVGKVGSVIAPHWAHLRGRDCDDWHSEEGEWHREWKGRFPEHCREFVMKPHRADVRLPNSQVIEFQSKGLSPAEFREREKFYGRLVWVIDGREAFLGGRIVPSNPAWSFFRWRRPWRSLNFCLCRVFIDLGHLVVEVVRRPIGKNDPWESRPLTHEAFVAKFLSEVKGDPRQANLFGGRR